VFLVPYDIDLCRWHDSFICVTWRIYTCGMTQSNWWHEWSMCTGWHDPFIRVTWFVCVIRHIYMCNLTHSHVCNDLRVPLIECVVNIMSHIWTSDVMHHSSTSVARLIHMCDMTHSHVLHDWVICVTRCHMTHSYVRHNLRVSILEHVVKLLSHINTSDMMHNSSTCVARLIYTCDVTYSYVSHD